MIKRPISILFAAILFLFHHSAMANYQCFSLFAPGPSLVRDMLSHAPSFESYRKTLSEYKGIRFQEIIQRDVVFARAQKPFSDYMQGTSVRLARGKQILIEKVSALDILNAGYMARFMKIVGMDYSLVEMSFDTSKAEPGSHFNPRDHVSFSMKGLEASVKITETLLDIVRIGSQANAHMKSAIESLAAYQMFLNGLVHGSSEAVTAKQSLILFQGFWERAARLHEKMAFSVDGYLRFIEEKGELNQADVYLQNATDLRSLQAQAKKFADDVRNEIKASLGLEEVTRALRVGHIFALPKVAEYKKEGGPVLQTKSTLLLKINAVSQRHSQPQQWRLNMLPVDQNGRVVSRNPIEMDISLSQIHNLFL